MSVKYFIFDRYFRIIVFAMGRLPAHLGLTYCLFFACQCMFGSIYAQSENPDSQLPTYSFCLGNEKEYPHPAQLIEFHERDIVGNRDGLYYGQDVKDLAAPHTAEDSALAFTFIQYNPDKLLLLERDSFTIIDSHTEQYHKPLCEWGKFRNLEDGSLIYVFHLPIAAPAGHLVDRINEINKERLPYIITGQQSSPSSKVPDPEG